MKIAVTGKGGVGKTTISAGLARLCARAGNRVIAIDADPDSNLAATLGFPNPEGIDVLVDQKDLIAERTGARPGSPGSLFTLNPRVDDVPESFCPEHRGIRMLAIGGSRRQGGSGCFCPESTFLRSLLSHLFFRREDVVILDMEAGIEHLTRGTARGVDALIVVVEPGQRSLETASRIAKLAADLEIDRIQVVANKLRGPEDRRYIEQELDSMAISGFLPYRSEAVACGMGDIGIDDLLEGPLGRELEAVRVQIQSESVRLP